MIQHDPANADIARFLRRLQWGLVAFAVGWVIWLLGPVLTPFVLAALIGWLGDPMVDRLERRGRSRAVAVTLVFTLMTLLFMAWQMGSGAQLPVVVEKLMARRV